VGVGGSVLAGSRQRRSSLGARSTSAMIVAWSSGRLCEHNAALCHSVVDDRLDVVVITEGTWFFRADFPAKLRGAMFDGLYLRNEESRLKFGAFVVLLEYNTSLPRHRPHRPPCGKGAPSKIGKKSKFSKIKPSLAGSGEKCFGGFRPGREYVVGEPIA